MTSDRPFDVSEELAKLRYEKKNGQMKRLPANATVQRRPIIHPAVASPFAGTDVEKVVYVSTKTPFMSAVKRVKKLLWHIEKRATQNVNMVDRGHGEGMRKLLEASDKIAKQREEVIVKASGRAMTKALNVGEWFSNKEKDVLCKVEVRSGSVSVVDDVLEAEPDLGDGNDEVEGTEDPSAELITELEAGDTTMELFGEKKETQPENTFAPLTDSTTNQNESASTQTATKKKRRRGKRKRPTCDPDDLPEQRLRWIKTVEVAISLRT